MFRKLCFLVAAALLLSVAAGAQGLTDKIEVFGGYSYQRFATNPGFNSNGWELSGQYKVFSWLGGFADVDGHYGTFEGVRSTGHNFLVGPQVSFPARVSPFAHVFVGDARLSAGSASSSSLASGLGFGIDTSLVPQVAWRVVQVDIIHSHVFSQGERNTRLSTGIVIHF
jgi:hypothetical protein